MKAEPEALGADVPDVVGPSFSKRVKVEPPSGGAYSPWPPSPSVPAPASLYPAHVKPEPDCPPPLAPPSIKRVKVEHHGSGPVGVGIAACAEALASSSAPPAPPAPPSPLKGWCPYSPSLSLSPSDSESEGSDGEGAECEVVEGEGEEWGAAQMDWDVEITHVVPPGGRGPACFIDLTSDD